MQAGSSARRLRTSRPRVRDPGPDWLGDESRRPDRRPDRIVLVAGGADHAGISRVRAGRSWGAPVASRKAGFRSRMSIPNDEPLRHAGFRHGLRTRCLPLQQILHDRRALLVSPCNRRHGPSFTDHATVGAARQGHGNSSEPEGRGRPSAMRSELPFGRGRGPRPLRCGGYIIVRRLRRSSSRVVLREDVAKALAKSGRTHRIGRLGNLSRLRSLIALEVGTHRRTRDTEPSS